MLKEYLNKKMWFFQKLVLQKLLAALLGVMVLAGYSLPLNAQVLNGQALLSEQVLLSYIETQKFSKTAPVNLFNPRSWQMKSNSSSLGSDELSVWLISSYAPTNERIKQAANERECLSQAIYHEARGEPEKGQWAVVNIILNRVVSSSYPSTICGVIFQNANGKKYACQFTFACDGRADSGGEGNRIVRISWVRSNLIALAAYKQFQIGKRPNILPSSALFYHTSAVSPNWSEVYKVVAEIGNHIFYAKS